MAVASLQAGVCARPGARWLAVGATVLGLATLYFLARTVRVDGSRARRFHVITTVVSGVAFASYLAMFHGVGVTAVTVQGRGTVTVYWARYADWLLTTPLLLVALGLLVGVDGETLFGAAAVDAFVIVTGLVAALSEVQVYRYVWWAISTFAFLFVLYFLAVPLTARARSGDARTASTFRTLRNVTFALWTAYPVWWLAGTGGAGLLPLSVETLGFAILDVLAKVGFGLILLRSPAVVGDASVPDPDARVPADPAE